MNKDKSKEVISILLKDKKKSLEEQLIAIGCSLKNEYEDFQESLDLEMSVEMGEVYKEKLAQVFDILKKEGVKFE